MILMTYVLPTAYQQVIHKTRYARWMEAENRRENWDETVGRYTSYMFEALEKHNGYSMSDKIKKQISEAILTTKVMPSMRGLMTAGPALDRDSTCLYNCSYLPVDSLRSFDEAMYILMCGTGVGYSVESRYVNQLPEISEHFEKTDTTIVVEDSKAGWARSLKELLALLWQGQVPSWDMSQVRPAGARLKTFGGRASGPDPLDRLFKFSVALIKSAAGRKLTPLEAHDIMCKIAEVVVVGGVRRSAMISLSDLEDRNMAAAKSGSWWEYSGQRALANNSAVYGSRPTMEVFMDEWKALYDSKSGERGIFSRAAAQNVAEKNGRRDHTVDFGTNPCSEIILRPYQFCNLTEVIVRDTDTLEELKDKVELATILGTVQSSFTRFKYLRKIWQKNSEEESLLGVSLTGQLSHPVLNGSRGVEELSKWLDEMREHAVKVNAKWAKEIGVNQAAAITCVKPSGTVSQLVNASSGMHPWHSQYYTRTIRGDMKDPITSFLVDMGIKHEPDVMKPNDTMVFSFPIAAPEGATLRQDLTAVQHLDIWLTYQRHWAEHKPSITVSVKENEWMAVGAWVYEHIDEMSGVSFLPYSEHTYQQAPYQECTKEEYDALVSETPANLDWKWLEIYETFDGTTSVQDLACVAGACDISDFGTAKTV
jgi:ribonucleoside-diphosphate reductase alpha chain